jgi:rhodanese-related sulfurtransferase
MRLQSSNMTTPASVGREIIILWLFAISAFCIGIMTNRMSERPLPLIYQGKWERVLADVERLAASDHVMPWAVREETQYVELAEFQQLTDSDALIVDARPAMFHRNGHIPRALPLPRDEFVAYYLKQRDVLERYRTHHIFVYCQGGDCEDSDFVAAGLRRLGFDNILIYRGGWNEWIGNGLPQERS